MNVPLWLQRLRGSSGQTEMGFFDHLDELRSMLLSCLLALLLLTVGAWFASGPVMNYLVTDVARLERAVYLKPMEPFATRIKVALLMAFMAGLPYIGFQVWSFVVPGLLGREKRVVFPLVFWSSILFRVGVGFAPFALSPTMLLILRQFSTEFVHESLSIAYLLDFLVKMAFACGILFQLPLIVAILSFFGIVTPEFLKSKWRHAIVAILFIAAVVTPGDGPSQLVLAVPIIFLYFISIWISAAIHRGKSNDDDDPGTDLAPSDGGDADDGDEGDEGADDVEPAGEDAPDERDETEDPEADEPGAEVDSTEEMDSADEVRASGEVTPPAEPKLTISEDPPTPEPAREPKTKPDPPRGPDDWSI